MSGSLAALWGNADFDIPPVERATLVAGIGLHDRAFGYLDTWPIGKTPDDEWLELTRRGFFTSWSDPLADLIVKHHLARLVSWTDNAGHRALGTEMDEAIGRALREVGRSRAELERIDRITNLLDMISFTFCFEQPAEGEVAVYARNGSEETRPVRYVVERGEVRLDPWPLSVDEHTGYLVAYAAEGYPAQLDPIVVSYRVARA